MNEMNKRMIVEDMLLTVDTPTTAGSKMLDGYMSLLESEALARAKAAGYAFSGKAKVGEFAIDLLGETSFHGAIVKDGVIKSATAESILSGDADVALCLDVNGAPRRAAAQAGLVSVKPTYGRVSRYGTVPVACSGETVSVMAKTAADCRALLDAVAGHDDKDGTSLPEALCTKVSEAAPVRRVALVKNFKGEKIGEAIDALKAAGIEVIEMESEILAAARAAWNVLMCAELCNNVSRYDGVKYGYRAENFMGLDELYTNSRTEAFGELLKTAILFGSETLSTENYKPVYDKCLRTRRVICEEFAKILSDVDAVLLPVVSALAYSEASVAEKKHLAFEENLYTAPASITGLPAVVAGGVQLVGKAFSENALLDAAKIFTGEEK